MTLVAMTKQDFDSMNDERLSWACVEPTLMQIRGKNMTVKAQALSQLTKGQQALCMFRVLYDHAKNSASEFYAWISYLLGNSDYWSGVIGGLRFFGDTTMIHLLDETKLLLEERNQRLGYQLSDATFNDLEQDHELSNAVSLLFDRFLEIAMDSLKHIGTYIRSNQHEFVIFQN
jgi:hypothetical protein